MGDGSCTGERRVTMKPVGHLTRYETGLFGERGTHYSYITAGNGVWIEAEGPLLAARIPVAPGTIRGLAPDIQQLVLRHGRIPNYIWQKAMTQLTASISTELFIAITCIDGQYEVVRPEQDRDASHVKYQLVEGTILDMHSHHQMPAFFSTTDNADETGFQVYCVLGGIGVADRSPQVHLRVGIYGHHWSIPWDSMFEGKSESFLDIGLHTTSISDLTGYDLVPEELGVDPHDLSRGGKTGLGVVENIRARIRRMGVHLS